MQDEANQAADQVLAGVDAAIAAVGTARPITDSTLPLGAQLHRAVDRLVARDIAVVRAELLDVAQALRDAVALLDQQVRSAIDPGRQLPDGRPGLARRVSDLLDRLLALEAVLGAGPEAVAVLLERVERLEREVDLLRPDAPTVSSG